MAFMEAVEGHDWFQAILMFDAGHSVELEGEDVNLAGATGKCIRTSSG
jgi:hypothetical protein